MTVLSKCCATLRIGQISRTGHVGTVQVCPGRPHVPREHQSDGYMYERQGKSWQPEEDQRLSDAFRAGTKITELCSRHQRGRRAIRARLRRLGLIDRPGRSTQSSTPLSADQRSGSRENDKSLSRESINSSSNPAPPATQRLVSRNQSLQPRVDAALPLVRIAQSIDHLISALKDLQTLVAVGKLSEPNLRTVTLAYEQFDENVSNAVIDPPGQSIGNNDSDIDTGDPIPDRLRTAVLRIIRACVSKTKDRYITMRVLGLTGDGAPATLAAVGEELSLSRERIRQRNVAGGPVISAAD